MLRRRRERGKGIWLRATARSPSTVKTSRSGRLYHAGYLAQLPGWSGFNRLQISLPEAARNQNRVFGRMPISR